MADDEVMFLFGNNAAENAAEIAAAMRTTVNSIQAAAREASGTSVPFKFGDSIIAEANRAVEESRAVLRNMLDPRNFKGNLRVGDANKAITQAGVGAYQQTQREVDNLLQRLGPDARAQLVDTGEIEKLMEHVRRAIEANLRSMYDEVRGSFDASLRRRLPTSRRITGIESRAKRALEDQHSVLEGVNNLRSERVFDPESEDVNAELYIAEEHRAAMLRERDRVAREKARKEKERADEKTRKDKERADKEEAERARKEGERQLAEQLAYQVRAGHEDPYAKGLGYTLNPNTGLPTRATAAGYSDITNPRQVEDALRKIQDLRDAHTETLHLQNNPDFQMMNSTFGRLKEGNELTFFKKSTQGGHEILQLLTGVESKTLSARDAQTLYNKQVKSGEDALKAETKAAERVAEQAQKQADAAAKRQASQVRGFIPGVMSGAFGSGFNGGGPLDKGAILGNLGKTVGSAARYSLAYGGFYQFEQAAGDALRIFQDYQDSFTDYQVALGSADSATQSTTNGLMELSRVLGENVGAAYDSAARGVRAFAADASEADKQLAGLATASAAQKVSVIANKSLTDATGDVIAIGSAYGLSASQSELQIPDAISNAKRTLGGDPTQIAQGLANFAVSAKLAGYSIQEAANLISLVQAKTDESGQAVATRLTRVIQILGGSTGKSLAGDVNRALGSTIVDTKADPRTQLMQFGKAYVQAGRNNLPELQAQITSQLGGTGNLKEILPLLEASGQARLAKALKDAIAGAGEDEYARKINTIGLEVKALYGSIQNLVVLAANADLFAPFAVGVKVLNPALHILEKILQVYEKIEGLVGKIPGLGIPGTGKVGGAAVTTVAEAGLGVYAFQKLKASTFAADVAANNKGLVGSVARTAGVGADAAVTANAAGLATAEAQTAAALEAETVATGAATAAQAELAAASTGAAAQAVTMRGAFGTVAGAMKKLAPWAIGIGSLFAFQDFYDKGQKLRDTETTRTDLAKTQGFTPEKLQTTVDSLRTLSANQQKSLGWLDKLGNLGPRRGSSEITDAQADHVQSILKRVRDEERALNTSAEANSTFGVAAARTVDSLSQAFALLTENGENAHQVLTQYFSALMTPPADTLGTYETPDQSAAHYTQQLQRSIFAALPKVEKPGLLGKIGIGFGDGQQDLKNTVNEYFNADAADRVLTAGIKRAGSRLDRKQVTALGAQAFDAGFKPDGKNMSEYPFNTKGKTFDFSTDASTIDRPLGDIGDFRKKVIDEYFAKRIEVLQHQAHELAPMTPAELTELLTAQQSALGEVDPTDPTATFKQARQNYLQLQARKNATGTPAQARVAAMRLYEQKNGKPEEGSFLDETFGGMMREVAGNVAVGATGQLRVAVRNARHVMREAAVAEAEDHRKAVEAALKDSDSDATHQAVRLKAAKLSFRRAGADVALIEGLMESMDRQTVLAILEYRKTAVQTAKLAYEKQMDLVNQAQTLLNEQLGGPALSGHPGAGAGGQDPSHPVPKAIQRKADESKRVWEARKRQYAKALEAYDRAAIPDETFPNDASSGEKKLTAWQQRALRRQAKRNPDDTVNAARDNLNVARANLDAIKDHHSSEYFSALKSVTEAQNALGDALAQRSTAAVTLAAALAGGGQLATAKAALDTAKIQLTTQTPGTPGYDEAMAAVVNGHKGMRDAHAQDIASAANVQAARAGGGQMAQAKAALKTARAHLNAQTANTSEWDDAYAQYLQAQQGLRDAVASRTGAIASASAARNSGGIAAAKAQLVGARAQLNATVKGTIEWFQALASFYQGQWALRDAMLQYRNNLDLLRGDSTDPVEQARDAARAAARKLRSDRRNGAGRDVIAEDRVAAEQARNAARGAKFDQRFSDMQTAEQLGRITFKKYMSYLDSEHDRLTKIKHRTRQQQDQLDQVDKAMKDAVTSMDAQFNMGDINTHGMVYQARRFQAEVRNAAAAAQMSNNTHITQTVTIDVNGADTAKVRKIIEEVVGGPTRTRTTQARRR